MHEKTNAMRLLDKAGVSYGTHQYDGGDGIVDGVSVAHKIGVPEARVYKTLVTQGHSGGHYVFVIPVAAELDLKLAAKAVGEKSIEMIPLASLTKLTGYVRGGCSPFGMKKPFPTLLDSTAEALESIVVSAGRLGQQVELAPADLLRITGGKAVPVIHTHEKK